MSTLRVLQPTQLLTKTNAPEFIRWIEDSVSSGAKYLLIDLQNVAFMDSTGLGVLVSAHKFARKIGCDLAMCSFNQQVRMVVEIAGLEKVFTIYKNQDEFETSILQSSVTLER
ncbi:MAG TPA: STAS domain-containing protein [Elainellaceae cyanobacterium]